MKKIFYSFCFICVFSFIYLLSFNICTKAAVCSVNGIDYELPATIGMVNSYSFTIYDDLPLEATLPDKFSSNITLISIENENSCLNIKNFPYKYSSSYNSKLKKTTYTYSNILVDTKNNNSWSYSGILPTFFTTEKAYTINYQENNISTYTVSFYANVGHLTTLEELQSYIFASNDVEGLDFVSIEPTSNAYTPSYNIIGNYLVSFLAIDSSGNKAILDLWVHVVDITSPIISGPTMLESKMSSPLTTEEISSFLTVSDNYDQNIIISMQEDTFTFNEQKIGDFYIIFNVIDSSNNISTHKINIKTIDDVSPTINGVSHIIKGSYTSMDLNYVKNLLFSKDNTDEDVTSSIKITDNTYSGNENNIGHYYLTFISTDSYGNTSTPYTVNIEVYDSVPPIFHVDENIIITDITKIVTKEEILELFIKTNQITTEDISLLSLVKDSYSNNSNRKGIYNVTYSLQDGDTTKLLSVDLKVNSISTSNSSKYVLALGCATLLSIIFIIKKLINKTLTI